MKKTVRIYFLSFWRNFDMENNFISNILKKQYNIAIDKDNPEYVFFTRFDSEIYKYNCVRIFYNAENFAPDFNLCDYAIGFDEITFGDRYIRYPLYLISDYTYYANDNYEQDFIRATEKHKDPKSVLESKEGFCSIVVSRSDCEERERFFELLSKYKTVSSGGRWKNNVGGPVVDKFEFCKKYKFSIAFENSSTPGYTTEKLMQAFGAGTVPIYFGNPHISEEFNTKAFINVHDYQTFEDVVEAVKRVDNDDELYLSMLSEPAFVEGMVEAKRDELEKFIFNIFNQEPKKAIRRHGQLIAKYEKKYKVGTIVYNICTRITYIRYLVLHLLNKK